MSVGDFDHRFYIGEDHNRVGGFTYFLLSILFGKIIPNDTVAWDQLNK